MRNHIFRWTAALLCCAVLIAGWMSLAHAAESSKISAAPSRNQVFVDGKEMAPAAYKVNGSNYFKLRDLAFMLSGTEKQFSCDFDKSAWTITLATGKTYTPVGGEMTAPSERADAKPSSMPIVLDGKKVELSGFLIRGNNYFKLRDVMALFEVEVHYEEATSAVKIVTKPALEEPTAKPDQFDDWSAPLNTTSDRWQQIVAESGEVREIPIHFRVTAFGDGAEKPAAGCKILLYFMDKATGQPDCLIGSYETGEDGYVHTTLILPWKYVEDSPGWDSLKPSWFGYRLQDTMEIDGKTFYGKFIVCDWSFLHLDDFYPVSMTEAEIRQMVYEESVYRQLEETAANRSKS